MSAEGWTCRTLAMRHLFAKRAHCKWHNLRHRKGAAMPSLVPERRRCPPKWWVPFQGGTISGETRRKGVNNFFIWVTSSPICGVPGRRGCNTPKFRDVQPVLPEFHPHAGKDVAQHSRVKGREICFTLIYILFISGIFLRARHNCAGRTDALC